MPVGRMLAGQLGVLVICVGLLAAFFVGLIVVPPILGVFGVSEQISAAIVGGAVLVGFWAVGLKLLFGGSGTN